VDRRGEGSRGRQARNLEELLVGLLGGERGMVESKLVGPFTEQLLHTKRRRPTH